MTTSIATKTYSPKLYQDFVAKEYFSLSSAIQSAYGDPANHFTNYVRCHGFSDWLESLRDCELTESFTERLAHTFVHYANRLPSEIPSVLVSIARQYNVELPVVEGILTAKFWEDHAYQNLWATTESAAA